MTETQKHIVAGSGGFQYVDGSWRVGPILRYAFELSGKERPRVCLLATAVGDDRQMIARFYDACSREEVHASHLELFPMPNHVDTEAFLLAQDVLWVGGGSVANLLAVWRVHGLDRILRTAWEQGIILAGVSAGSICWHVGGTTDSFGTRLRPVTNGLGFLPYSSGVHYDSEPQRRPFFQQLIEDGTLPEGYATDDGVVLHFVNTTLRKALSNTAQKFAYHVYRDESGHVQEERIVPQLLT
jgi:peptidase E